MFKQVLIFLTAGCLLAVVLPANAADTGYVRISSVSVDAEGVGDKRGNAYFKIGDDSYYCKKSITELCLKVLLTALAADREIKGFYKVKGAKSTELFAVRIH